jgi:hypothetical protein
MMHLHGEDDGEDSCACPAADTQSPSLKPSATTRTRSFIYPFYPGTVVVCTLPIGASFTEAIRCDSTGPPVIGAQRDARSFVVPDAARTWATDREEDVHSLFKKKEEEDIRAVLWLTPPPYPSRPCHCC